MVLQSFVNHVLIHVENGDLFGSEALEDWHVSSITRHDFQQLPSLHDVRYANLLVDEGDLLGEYLVKNRFRLFVVFWNLNSSSEKSLFLNPLGCLAVCFGRLRCERPNRNILIFEPLRRTDGGVDGDALSVSRTCSQPFLLFEVLVDKGRLCSWLLGSILVPLLQELDLVNSWWCHFLADAILGGFLLLLLRVLGKLK